MSLTLKKDKNLFIFLPAILISGAQLIFYPLFLILYGNLGLTATILLIMVFLSMVMGEARIIPLQIIRRISLILGSALILLGISFSNSILFFIKIPLIRFGITALLFLFLFTCGQMLFVGVYHQNKFHKNYIMINGLSFVMVLVWTLLVPRIGLDHCLTMIGLVLLFITLSQEKKMPYLCAPTNHHSPEQESLATVIRLPYCPQSGIEKKKINESRKSIILGFIAAGYISCYFQTIYLAIFPNGYEFNTYLSLSFLLLAISTGLYKKLVKANMILSAEFIVYLGINFAIFIFIIFFGGQTSDGFFLDPLSIFNRVPRIFSNPIVYSLIFSCFLMLPYVFFAAIIPAQETTREGINHLFFCSIGNLLGLIVFGLFFIDFGIHIKLIILGCTVGVVLFLRYGVKSKLALAATIFLLMLVMNLPANLDQRITVQGQRAFLGQRLILQQNQPHSVGLIQNFFKKWGEAGYLFNNHYTLRLGFGGYSTASNNMHDLQHALTTRELINTKTKNILFLGLGNEIILQQVYAKLNFLGINDFKIDIVDNFSPLLIPKFRSAMEKDLGFKLEDPRIKLYYADAFQYLLFNHRQPYDLIVWNLSIPAYTSSAFLHTQEMGRLLAQALTKEGYLAGRYLIPDQINCSLMSSFNSYSSYPSSYYCPYSSLIATNGTNFLKPMLGNRNGPPFPCDEKNKIGLRNYIITPHLGPFCIEDRVSFFEKNKNSFKQDKEMLKTITESPESVRLLAARLNIGFPFISIVPLTGPWKDYGLEFLTAVNIFRETQGKSDIDFRSLEKQLYPVIIDSGSNARVGLRYHAMLQMELRNKAFYFMPFMPDLSTSSENSFSLISFRQDMKELTFNVFPMNPNLQASVSSLFPSLKGFQDLISDVIGQTRNVYVLKNKSNPLTDHLRSILNVQAIHPSFIVQDIKEISSLEENISSNDLFIIPIEKLIDLPDMDFREDISEMKKLIIVTGPETYDFANLPPSKNTAFLFFWHPAINYSADNAFDSCHFAQLYREETGRLPSYISALTYGALVSLSKAVKNFNLNDSSNGVSFNTMIKNKIPQLARDPVILYFDATGYGQIWIAKNQEICADEKENISSRFEIKKYDLRY